MEADPVSGLVHLNDAFSATCRQLLELFPLLLSRADVSTVCCLRMLVNRVSRSPMEACLNHGNEIFRRPDPPDFGALGGRAPDSGLVTDILSITSHSPWTWHPSKKWNKKKAQKSHFTIFSFTPGFDTSQTDVTRYFLVERIKNCQVFGKVFA